MHRARRCRNIYNNNSYSAWPRWQEGAARSRGTVAPFPTNLDFLRPRFSGPTWLGLSYHTTGCVPMLGCALARLCRNKIMASTGLVSAPALPSSPTPSQFSSRRSHSYFSCPPSALVHISHHQGSYLNLCLSCRSFFVISRFSISSICAPARSLHSF